MDESKKQLIEALEDYQGVVRARCYKILKSIRENLLQLLSEGINEEYRLCLSEDFIKFNYTKVNVKFVEEVLREIDTWVAGEIAESYLKKNNKNWNNVFKRHIGAIASLDASSKEYQKCQKALEMFREPQEG